MIQQQLDAQFMARLRTAVAAQLPEYLPNQRWFGSKAKRIQSVQLSDCIPVPLPNSLALLALASVEFIEGPGETYVLPLLAPAADRGFPADSIVVRLLISDRAPQQPLIDALSDREFLTAILSAIIDSNSSAGERGILRANPEPALHEYVPTSPGAVEPRRLKAEQSNTSIVYGDRFILKFFRRLEVGIHPDLEIGRFLTAVAHFPNIPPLCGSLTYESREANTTTFGILQGFVPNQGDAWSVTVDSLAKLFAPLDHPKEELGSAPNRSATFTAKSAFGESTVSAHFGKQLELIGLLGKRTAELHLALASSSVDPAFAPEPFTPEVREGMDVAFHDLAVRNFETLRLKLADLSQPAADTAREILQMEDEALLTLHSILERDIDSIRIRIHGDYHLGQLLYTGSDFFIIDFEGEPARPLSERRNKRSPLQDVAGMLRSFQYAARFASLAAKERWAHSQISGANSDAQSDRLAAQWHSLASREFLRSYRSTAGDAKFLPVDPAGFDALLKVHLLEKAIYELGYELNNRPAWLAIPLQGIRDILATKS